MNGKVKIEVQHFHGCPNSPLLVERVKEAIKGIEDAEYTETLVETNEAAKKFKFRGSPTLLINGRDFEDLPEPDQPALACRYYSNGIPDVEAIRKLILSHNK